ncbi:MAG: hypothetical protein PVG07_14640 [Acidobacteriota bacterium]|jgi:hypothetical protein
MTTKLGHPRTSILLLTALLVPPLLAAPPAAGQERPPVPRPSVASGAPPGPASRAELARAEALALGERGESHLFHVALVLAERGPGGNGDEPLPEAVQKALDDIRDFLPYSRYRVADSALVRSAGSGGAALTGPDGTTYRADFMFTETEEDGEAVLDMRHFALRRGARELPAPSGPGGPAVRSGPAVAPRASEPPLSASFRMTVGETVVVGSSRLESDGSTGQRALIVLVTAVP